MACLLAVTETDQAAEAIARRGAQWLVESYVNSAQASNVDGKLQRHFCAGALAAPPAGQPHRADASPAYPTRRGLDRQIRMQ